MVRTLEIRSIVIPPLGCGNGGLAWDQVQPLIVAAFADLDDVDVLVYPPTGTPIAEAMPDNTERPAMTLGKAALVDLIARYQAAALEVTLIEVQKLGR